jgi:hypothetical protein
VLLDAANSKLPGIGRSDPVDDVASEIGMQLFMEGGELAAERLNALIVANLGTLGQIDSR